MIPIKKKTYNILITVYTALRSVFLIGERFCFDETSIKLQISTYNFSHMWWLVSQSIPFKPGFSSMAGHTRAYSCPYTLWPCIFVWVSISPVYPLWVSIVGSSRTPERHFYTGTASSKVTLHRGDCEPHKQIPLTQINKLYSQLSFPLTWSPKHPQLLQTTSQERK